MTQLQPPTHSGIKGQRGRESPSPDVPVVCVTQQPGPSKEASHVWKTPLSSVSPPSDRCLVPTSAGRH